MITTINEWRKIFEGPEYNYRLLSRLQSDCDYVLGSFRNYYPKDWKNWEGVEENRLWAGSIEEQISTMRDLWNSFPEDQKPEWLSLEDIDNYEKELLDFKELVLSNVNEERLPRINHKYKDRKNALDIRPGDIVGNTVIGFDFEFIKKEGNYDIVKDLRTGETKQYRIGNMKLHKYKLFNYNEEHLGNSKNKVELADTFIDQDTTLDNFKYFETDSNKTLKRKLRRKGLNTKNINE